MEDLEVYQPVYEFVRSVPAGKVVTYGQVAECVTGVSLTARQVGTAMSFAPPEVPWQRVVGAGGMLPIAKRGPELHLRQRELLINEGVVFAGDSQRVDMGRCQWGTDAAEASQGDLFADEVS